MKTIPAQLLTHLALPVTTWCYLVKVECVGTFAGTILAFTNLDIDVVYNDLDTFLPDSNGDLTVSAGALTYQSGNGFTPMKVAMTSSLGVDDSEMMGVTGSNVTEQMIRAGLFNSAKVTCYRVNYEDLTAGRHEVVEYGRAGQTVYSERQFWTEFLSLSTLLKQPISKPYSIKCNAIFGSQPIGTGGEQPEEKHPCRMPWVWGATGTVSSVNGTENDRIFSDSGRTENDGWYSDIGGVVEWLSGNNAGNQMEVDDFSGHSSGGTFTLALGMPFPIQVGDTYRPRRDCDKLFPTCRDVYANTDNNRSQNLIPVDGTAQVPAAEIVKA